MQWQYFVETLRPTNFKEMQNSKSTEPTFTFSERSSEYDIEAEIGSTTKHLGMPRNIYLDIRGHQGWELVQVDNTDKFNWTFYFKRDFSIYLEGLEKVTEQEIEAESYSWSMPNPHEGDEI